jgi:hypothetical protein
LAVSGSIHYSPRPCGLFFLFLGLSLIRVLCLCVSSPERSGPEFGYLRRGQRAVLRPNNTRSGGIRGDSGRMAAASLERANQEHIDHIVGGLKIGLPTQLAPHLRRHQNAVEAGNCAISTSTASSAANQNAVEAGNCAISTSTLWLRFPLVPFPQSFSADWNPSPLALKGAWSGVCLYPP